MRKHTNTDRRNTGQLSIFMALVFQMLFVFFAMSLNIALVVHDKINLQNSVDIATYYGAMKQAELLNTIAHINYQIRQSWKLLVWRYRVLGSYGTTARDFTIRTTRGAPQKQPDADFLPTNFGKTSDKTYADRYGTSSFCIGHPYWGNLIGSVGRDDHVCYAAESILPNVKIQHYTGLANVVMGGQLNQLTRNLKNYNSNITATCTSYAYNAWLLAFMSTVLFQKDQSVRKHTIYALAKHLELDKDLDNNLIETGVRNTFKKNLTYINKKSYEKDSEQFKTFSSLKNVDPDKWLKDDTFLTIPFYSNITTDDQDNNCAIQLATLKTPSIKVCPAGLNSACNIPGVRQFTKRMFEINHQNRLCNNKNNEICDTSAGLYKNPDFVVYYSTYASLKYENQIFLPRGNKPIVLKAMAYAKPFGGRIGPQLNTDQKLPEIPLNNYSMSTKKEFAEFDKKYAPNYSRYPGDPFGLRSQVTQYHWDRYFNGKTTIQHRDINYFIKDLDNPDILAKDPQGIKPIDKLTTRKWELAAISPDLFDVTYFTILPFFMDIYFPKVKTIMDAQGIKIRGDLGYAESFTPRSDTYSIKYQIGQVWNEISNPPNPHDKPFYKIQKLEHILTGWTPPKKKYDGNFLMQYELSNSGDSLFGKCDANSFNIMPSKRRIAGGCVYGGRTGYSVKIIHDCYIQSLKRTNSKNGPDWHKECEGV